MNVMSKYIEFNHSISIQSQFEKASYNWLIRCSHLFLLQEYKENDPKNIKCFSQNKVYTRK